MMKKSNKNSSLMNDNFYKKVCCKIYVLSVFASLRPTSAPHIRLKFVIETFANSLYLDLGCR